MMTADPMQGWTDFFGGEIGATGLVMWAIQLVALTCTWQTAHPKARSPMRVLANQLPPLAFVNAGALLFAGHLRGIYWVLPGT
jgi:hypothetical protein